MRRFRCFALTAIFILTCFAGSAFADSVHMSFIGPGSNSLGGVYTYPYTFSINGGAPVQLVCDAFNNEIISGETWDANVYSLTSGSGMFGSELTNYKTAGLIYNGITAGTIDPKVGNWAIWGLFSATAANDPIYTSSGAKALSDLYYALVGSTPDSAYEGILLFTPKPGSQSWGGTPQEFIGRVTVPEPGEIAMFAMLGMFTLGAFVFRKKLGLKLALQA